jgi:hypothetical protein
MSFKIPTYIKNYLNTKQKTDFGGFINNSTYYTQVDYMYQNYMMNVIRPCISYGSGVFDGISREHLSACTGKAIVDGASRLIIGDRIFFEGEEKTRKFFTDIWQANTNFVNFLARAEKFKLLGGTAICKINTDSRGRNTLSAFRLDRTLPTFDECGNITSCVFFISLLNETKRDSSSMEYWLVEERKYNEEGEKVIVYKVFCKSGIAQAPILPNPRLQGISFKNLPQKIQRELKALGIDVLNEEMLLPYRDGLGIWKLVNTPTNSCIPDVEFGDPLLFGVLDLIWATDIVFSGALIDVINGEGKILVPKQFLQQTLNALTQMAPGTKFDVTTDELNRYDSENFVYVLPSGFDKDKMQPLPIQFDIRAEQYRLMWETFQKEAIVRAGFAPTSIFPHLAPDGSAKTATEVTAEENLTRASVKQAHLLDIPQFNRMLREVAYQEGLDDDIQLKLTDYIGNKLLFDQNVRENYIAHLIPQQEAVQLVNGLSISETEDYITRINAEVEKQQQRESSFMGNGIFDQINGEDDEAIE